MLLTKVLKGAAGMGAGMITKLAVESVTPENVKKLDKVLIGIGGAVLAGIVGGKASEYMETQINEIKDAISKTKEKVEEA